MTGSKCKSCGSSDLEVDPSRGDTVCTNCGTVLEDSVIVSEMQFEENAHGGSTAIGQFVSSESSGGCRGLGGGFHSSAVKESREITLQNAKRGLSSLCQQLRLNQHCLSTAFNFYKMALSRHLTRGRKNAHVLAACLYITCRIEGTPHLLIDLSDIIQICAFELGRTYVKLSQALCINVPSVDPCLYVLRFANKLDFEDKTHEVTMTALRLVQRMKRDSMHSGRRPSGICGAALLMAARLHGFSRSVEDIIKVVQVHKTTLRRRLVEFGETPSSALTLQEFMTVDLEEEQDPPSYKAARAKDRERLKFLEDQQNAKEFSQLQCEIEHKLFVKKKRKHAGVSDNEEEEQEDEDGNQKKNNSSDENDSSEEEEDEERDEDADLDKFVVQSTLGIVGEYIDDVPSSKSPVGSDVAGPSIASMGLDYEEGETAPSALKESFIYPEDGDLNTDGLDDEELDSYIMNETEAVNKDTLWHTLNADYLQQQKEKEERLKKEREEGKPEKKKRKTGGKKKSANTPANSAGEAIEKMLQEKKISAKINYDVLKSLTETLKNEQSEPETKPKIEPKTEEVKQEDVKPKAESNAKTTKQEENNETLAEDGDDFDEAEDEYEGDTGGNVMSLAQMLNQHRNDDDYYGYDEDDY